jgi:hypothetical protein
MNSLKKGESSVGFTEFSVGLLSRPVFLHFGQGSPDGGRQPLLEAVLQDVILGPLGEDVDGAVFRDRTGDQNKRGIGARS